MRVSLIEGLGFLLGRDRGQASDFTAALDDHRQYLRRKRQAEELRQKFVSEEGEGEAGTPQQVADYSLKPGETIRISLSNVS